MYSALFWTSKSYPQTGHTSSLWTTANKLQNVKNIHIPVEVLWFHGYLGKVKANRFYREPNKAAKEVYPVPQTPELPNTGIIEL